MRHRDPLPDTHAALPSGGGIPSIRRPAFRGGFPSRVAALERSNHVLARVHLSVGGAKPAGMKPAPPLTNILHGGAGFMPADFFPCESPPTDRYTPSGPAQVPVGGHPRKSGLDS
jgi:hypothetical protein